jgi:hypothetical protein
MTCAGRRFTEIGEDVEVAGNSLRMEFETADAMMSDSKLAYAVMVNKMRRNASRLAGALGQIGSSAEGTGRVVGWADEDSIIHNGTKRPFEYSSSYEAD